MLSLDIFIDSLLDMSSDMDINHVKKNFFNFLQSHYNARTIWLYKVHHFNSGQSLQLIAHSNHKKSVFNETLLKDYKLDHFLLEQVSQVINIKDIFLFQHNNAVCRDDCIYSFFPSFDENKKIYLILVLGKLQHRDDLQSSIYKIYQIYSNYLELIDKLQRDKLTDLLNRETLHTEITKILMNVKSNHEENLVNQNQIQHNNRRIKLAGQQWLGILDIDFFKKINDCYGHLYGDEVLILVARVLEKNIRDFDLAFRYGGEEFVIILNAVDFNEAYEAFNRIRLAIKNFRFAKISNLTISIGAVQIDSQKVSSTVLSQADSALYFSKDNGRDQVNFYHLLAEQGIGCVDDKMDEEEIDFF